MFLGHFGLAFAAKRITREPSLGTTFIAAQFVDLLWPLLLVTGIEEVKIDPGNTAITPLDFVSYPYSHSLLAVMVWAVVFGLMYFLIRKNKAAAFILALLVISHWVLDFVTHRPDLPLTFHGTEKYGLGLWNNRWATIATELVIFVSGFLFYLRATQPKNKWGTISFLTLIVFFLCIYFMNIFGDPPPNEEVIGYVGFAQWIFIGWAYWVDACRKPFPDVEGTKKGLE